MPAASSSLRAFLGAGLMAMPTMTMCVRLDRGLHLADDVDRGCSRPSARIVEWRRASSGMGRGITPASRDRAARRTRAAGPPPQPERSMVKYGSPSPMRFCSPTRSASRGYQSMSIGRPTEMLDCMVESKEISTHLAASFCGVAIDDHAVEDRLAVLALAQLEVERVVGGLDEVALRVDVEQARVLAPIWPPSSRFERRLDVGLREERAVAPLHLAQRVAHQRRRRRTCCRRSRSSRCPRSAFWWLVEDVDDALGHRRGCPRTAPRSRGRPSSRRPASCENVAMWSTPALVRESEAKIMPESRRRATQ